MFIFSEYCMALIRIHVEFYGPWGKINYLDTCITTNSSTRVDDVKYMLQSHSHVVAHRMNIYFDQHVLEDHKTLDHYQVKQGDTLRVSFLFTDSPESILFLKHFLYGKPLIRPCVICMERNTNAYLMPCAHEDYCWTCVLTLSECAICRKEICGRHKKEL